MSRLYKIEQYNTQQDLEDNIEVHELALLQNGTNDVSIFAKLGGVITELFGEIRRKVGTIAEGATKGIKVGTKEETTALSFSTKGSISVQDTATAAGAYNCEITAPTIYKGRALAYATTSSWYYDLPVAGVKAGDIAIVQRATAVSVSGANFPIASECLDGKIRVYFNQQSNSTYYVNYLVIQTTT